MAFIKSLLSQKTSKLTRHQCDIGSCIKLPVRYRSRYVPVIYRLYTGIIPAGLGGGIYTYVHVLDLWPWRDATRRTLNFSQNKNILHLPWLMMTGIPADYADITLPTPGSSSLTSVAAANINAQLFSTFEMPPRRSSNALWHMLSCNRFK